MSSAWRTGLLLVCAVLLMAGVAVGGFAFANRGGQAEASVKATGSHDRRIGHPDGHLDESTLPEGSFGGRGGGGVTGDDYPYKHLKLDEKYDPWREYVRECTSFAAWALHSRNGFEMPFYGNAKDWGSKAAAKGFRVDSTPAVGAIAWSDSGKWGHVAWVAVVNGSSVTIEEYNYHGRGEYGTRTVPASMFRYIHFADIQTSTPAPALAPAPKASADPRQQLLHQPPPETPAPSGGGTAKAPAPSGGGASDTTPTPAPAASGGGAPASSNGGAPATTPAPTTTAPSPAPVPPRRYWVEKSGSHGSPTFTNVSNASGVGPRVPPMTAVEITCKVKPATTIASAQPDGYWYRIHSAPWNDQYYAVANTFWNGDTPGATPYTHYTDWTVPDC